MSTAGSSKGSIESVSGVAEAWDDERAVVQFGVDGGGVEGHVGVLAGNAFDARHGGDSVEARDPGRPSSLSLSMVAERLPGSEHRVEDEYQVLVQVAWEVDVVFDRLGRLLVALESHKAHRRRRQEGERPVEHTEAGAQDGNEADGTGDLLDLRLGQGVRIWTWRVGMFPVASATRIRASSFMACLKSAVVVRSSRRTASLWRLKGHLRRGVSYIGGGLTHTAGKPP